MKFTPTTEEQQERRTFEPFPAGEYDFVELLWWQKDNQETRALIIALEWCMIAVPEKISPWPKGIHDFEGMAERFNVEERNARLQEATFVRQNRKALAMELNSIFSSGGNELAKRYADASP